MKPILTREVKHVEQLWNDWEIRVATICSLALQILLLGTAGSRKRNYGMTFQAIIITFSLWLEYLLADYVATFALGYLSRNQDENNQVLIFWAPFLLLHLGGQDTITALSIEDSELWKRHLLNFGWQVALAIYVFVKLLPPISITCAAGFIFAAGILKYVQRIWALQRASMSSLRSSLVMDPDPGPNYAKFMKYYSSIRAGLDAIIEVVPERHEELGSRNETTLNPSIGQTGKDLEDPTLNIKYADVVCKAYDFFQTFKCLFVDLILSFEDRKGSQDYFIQLETEKAYKVSDIELFFMYDILHTKASVIHTWYATEVNRHFKELGWSIEDELDESILIWHIATDLLFHFYGWDKHKDDKKGETKDPCYPRISQHISNYMLFLLIAHPFMLPAGIGQIRFGDTCEEAKKFFRRKTNLGHKEATKMILSIKTEYDPKVVKGDRSKSVLFDGCKLAHQLQDLYSGVESSKKLEKMWKLISIVWVEMLCYTASKCGGYFHAKQLREESF
ncbi:hypothetical protein LUZ60_002437 [Juncus effusus]|nr:hypothetical protein LUZ60_002437 [Juncus effusus]